MDPITIVGAAASISQLLGMSSKVATSSRSLVRSIVDAPAEIHKLAGKLDRLEAVVAQLDDLRRQIPVTEVPDLLPETHIFMLDSCLELNVNAMKSLKSLHPPYDAKPPKLNFKGRVRWAAVDKRRAQAILADVREAEASLDLALSFLIQRIISLNHTSLAGLRSAQEIMLPTLKHHIKDALICVRDELLSSVKENLQVERLVTEEKRTQALIRTLGQVQQETFQDLISPRNPFPQQQARDSQHNDPALTVDTSSASDFASQTQIPLTLSPASPVEQENLGDFNSLVQTRLSEHSQRKPLSQFTGYIGHDYTSSSRPPSWLNFAVIYKMTSKRTLRKAWLVLNIRLRVISWRIVHFELRLRHSARHWAAIPWLGCSLSIINIRNIDEPIFAACRDLNLREVQDLLEHGYASIYDVDAETKDGLLEHVLRDDSSQVLHKTGSQAHEVLKYLLDQGCDPNTFHGQSRPALLTAFSRGFTECVSSMLLYGGDMDSFATNPSLLLDEVSRQTYQWQLSLLRSIGFSDWRVDDGSSFSLLHAACAFGDMDEVLFALEIAKIHANTRDSLGATPLNTAVERNRIGVASILLESHAHVNGGQSTAFWTPLQHSVRYGSHDMTHWLLFSGAQPSPSDLSCSHAWYHAWEGLFYLTSWNFIEYERMLTHLLMHGADLLQPSLDSHDKKFCEYWKCHFSSGRWAGGAPLTTPDFARAWSLFDQNFLHQRPQIPTQERVMAFERIEERRKPVFTMFWSSGGTIYKTASTRMERISRDEPQDPGDMASSTMPDIKSSLFYERISTTEGRRQMLVFPAVALLCNALQLAGFRAEMDDEGDVWFEDEDGDIYFDALEYQTDPGGSESPLPSCSICRNPARHGLGHVLREAEMGRQKLYEYRNRVFLILKHMPTRMNQ